MARTDATAVNAIMDISLTDVEIDVYIAIANSIVTDNLGSLTEFSVAQLTEIERWLTAHLITITRERRGVREKLGEAEVDHADVFEMGLKSTHYGQMVSMLDTSGTLAASGKKKISIKAITSFE